MKTKDEQLKRKCNTLSRKICFEAGYKQCKEEVLELIDEWLISFKTNCNCRMCLRFKIEVEELKARITG